MPSHGTAANDAVSALLREQIERRQQLGVQVCAYLDGQPIVDTCAGVMGPRDDRPVQPDSLFSSFSTTKGVAATALHIQVDRGLIDEAAPVARYWPEFAAQGKGDITVLQAITHQAGLHTTPYPNTLEHALDWQKGLDYIANLEPAWEPGTATGYHAITFGWIVGGIIQGATGRHIRDVIREDIAEPLGIAGECFVGIPDGLDDRLTRLQAPEAPRKLPVPIGPDHDFFKAMPAKTDVNYNAMDVRKACMPAANGHFSARALARIYAALACGGAIDGVRLMSEQRVREMSAVVTRDLDRVLLVSTPKAHGFFAGGPVDGIVGPMGPRPTAFGHPGAGGSIGFADPEVGLSVAVTINKMQNSLQGEGPTLEICERIREVLDHA